MKLSYISDLHLDKWIERGQTLKFLEELVQQTPLPGTDLVIAGDVSHDEIQFAEAMKFFCDRFRKVFFVFGNHEYFLLPEAGKEIVSSMERLSQLRELIESNSNAVLLDENRGIVDVDGVRIAGETMWYDTTKQEIFEWQQRCMADSRFIRGVDFDALSASQMNFYESVIDRVDVFVSHVPMMKVRTHDIYGDLCFRVSARLRPGKVYIFGHSHEQGVYVRNGALGLINALGYLREHNAKMLQTITIEQEKK